MDDIFRFCMEDLPRIIQAVLAILGGLKLISRYTPWSWDDHVLDKVEVPVKWLLDKLPKKPEEPKPKE